MSVGGRKRAGYRPLSRTRRLYCLHNILFLRELFLLSLSLKVHSSSVQFDLSAQSVKKKKKKEVEMD